MTTTKRMIALTAITAAALTGASATAQRLGWVRPPMSATYDVRIWEISRWEFKEASVVGAEDLATRLDHARPQARLLGDYENRDGAATRVGADVPYAAWHGRHTVFDGAEIEAKADSKIIGLYKVVIRGSEVSRFMRMKAQNGGRAYAPEVRLSRFELDFPRGETRSAVYATPKGREGYAYRLIRIEG